VIRAVVAFPSTKTLECRQHPAPDLQGDSDVLLKILDVGICGTDREIARFEYGSPPQGSPYLVIGHESLAQVVRVGSGVSRVKSGDLVVTTVRRPCEHPECSPCAHGRQDFCFTGDFTERGIKGRHGFMTELVVDHEQYMHVVPASLRAVGVLVEPLTIAEKALIQVWDVQDRLPWTAPGTAPGAAHGQKAVVLGAGPVGLLGALALVVRGFDTSVYSLEPAGSSKAKWVEAVGAHYVSAEATPLDQLDSVVGGIDLIYEATGASSLSFQALETLGVNGVFVFTGVPGRRGPIQIDGDLLMRNLVLKNQLVFGTVNAGADAFHAAIEDLARFHARWPAEVEALITSRQPPEAAVELLTQRPTGIKSVVTFG
jgi:glucose 1-dehydrogenase